MSNKFLVNRILLCILILSGFNNVFAKDASFSLIYYGFARHYGDNKITKKLNEDNRVFGLEYNDGDGWSYGAIKYSDSYYCSASAISSKYS